MAELDQLRERLCSLERLHPHEDLEPLTGGVSGTVVLAHHDPVPYVAKSARPQLAVADDWYADPARTRREALILQALDGRLGTMRVPRVVFYDEATNILGLEAFLPLPPTWKQHLIQSKVDPSVVTTVADAVATLHRLPPPADLDSRLGARLFDDLRLDPYYRTVAKRHASLAPALEALIDATRTVASPTLVHGDVNPKNILVTDSNPVLLDFEVIHLGEPAFDAGMILGHLALKALYHGNTGTGDRLSETPYDWWAHYRSQGGPAEEELVVRHLGGIMLARVLGKSTVDYLSRIQSESAVRLGRGLIEGSHHVRDMTRLLRSAVS